MSADRTVLVAGAAGFGGSGLVKALLNLGHRVIGLDQVGLGDAQLIRDIALHPRFRYIWKNLHDVDRDDIEGIDVVVHMAAQGDAPMGFGSPRYTTSQNVGATVALLEAARASEHLDKFVYAASGNEFGRPKYLPIDEEHPLTPANPYSFSKAASEMAVWAWQRAYGIPAVVLSSGVVVGPNMRREIFVFKWLWEAYHGRPIVVEGGDQTRDVTYVDDVIDGWILAIEAPSDRVVGQKFQISSGHELSVTRIAHMCREVTGADVPIEFVGYRPGEEGQREFFTIKKAQDTLGFCPRVAPAAAIKMTALWVKTQSDVGAGLPRTLD